MGAVATLPHVALYALTERPCPMGEYGEGPVSITQYGTLVRARARLTS